MDNPSVIKLIVCVVVFVIAEIIACFVFIAVKRRFENGLSGKARGLVTFKGTLERLVLYVGLLSGFSTVLVLFGALKLGTRLHDEQGCEVSNDYFIVGNLLSVLIVLSAVVVNIHWLELSGIVCK